MAKARASAASDDGGDDSDPYFIGSLARGLQVLSAFRPGRIELSQAEIAEIAGVSVPTALRIGHTLMRLGYLVRNPQTKGYRPGPNAIGVGLSALSSMMLPEVADPYLTQLRDKTGETVKMAVLQDTNVVYVARYPSLEFPPPAAIQVGTRINAATTSVGRAILAFMPPAEAREIVKRSDHTRFTARTIVDIDALMKELAATKKRGYAINDREMTENSSIGAPLIDMAGTVVGAINITVTARLTLAQLEERLAPHLCATAREISSVLPPGIGLS